MYGWLWYSQYVLVGGKLEERSHIVRKLAGNIVQLSQHKFASNVIEKCLEYGDPAAREIMIEEIIGYGDECDNLLVSTIKFNVISSRNHD